MLNRTWYNLVTEPWAAVKDKGCSHSTARWGGEKPNTFPGSFLHMTCTGTCYKRNQSLQEVRSSPRLSTHCFPCLKPSPGFARLNRTDSSWQGNRSFTQIQGQPFTFLSRSTERAVTVIKYHTYHLISKAETPVWA